MNNHVFRNPLDNNRYLYDDRTEETREGSLASYSKITTELEYEKYNQINLSNILQLKLIENTTNKSHKDTDFLKEKQNCKNLTNQTKILKPEQKKSSDIYNTGTTIISMKQPQPRTHEEQLIYKVLLLSIENQRLHTSLAQKKLQATEERDYQYRILQTRYQQSLKQKESINNYTLQIQKQLKEQMKHKDQKLEQSYETIKKMYQRNTELNHQISTLKRQQSIITKKYQNQISEYKTKIIINENAEKENLKKLQNTMNGKKEEIQRQLIRELESKSLKKIEELNSLNEQRKRKSEEEIRSLKFQISKLKSELNIKCSREKDLESELKKQETNLKFKEGENRQEIKKYEKKIIDLENQKNTLMNNLMKLQKQKEQIIEDNRSLSKVHREKLNEIDQNRIQKQREYETEKSNMRFTYQKLLKQQEDKIQELQIEIAKIKMKCNKEIEEIQKNYKIQGDNYKKNLNEIDIKTQNYELAIKNLRNQNIALKEEISDRYRAILMFEDKIKAYQRQIITLNSYKNTDQTKIRRQYQRKIVQREASLTYQQRPETVQSAHHSKHGSKQRKSLQRKQYQQQIQNKRKINKFPSSGIIKTEPGVQTSYQSQYKYGSGVNMNPIVNVNLSLRRNKINPRSSVDHNKSLMSEQQMNRKSKINISAMRTFY